ncbi:unnamed protein product [Lampetra fluviatilis]
MAPLWCGGSGVAREQFLTSNALRLGTCRAFATALPPPWCVRRDLLLRELSSEHGQLSVARPLYASPLCCTRCSHRSTGPRSGLPPWHWAGSLMGNGV